MLVDGFVRGTWKITHTTVAPLPWSSVIEPFELLLVRERDALAEEGERLVPFVGEGAETFEVRFAGKT